MDAAALLFFIKKRIVLFWLNWSLKNRTYSAHTHATSLEKLFHVMCEHQ